MKTIGQIAELTGISVRTLQYYDEIGLLKPACVTFDPQTRPLERTDLAPGTPGKRRKLYEFQRIRFKRLY